MNVNFLRKIPITLAAIVASSSVFAAMDMDSRVTQLEQQMKQVRTETANGTYGALTASARPEVEGSGWYIDVDVFYWHAKVGGTEYAYSDNSLAASFPIKGRTKDIDFDWDWGFRVGLGYNFEHDGWDVGALYTYFNSDGSDSTRAGLNSSIVPLRGTGAIVSGNPGSLTFTHCASAKSQFDFDFQSLDLDLGRNYFVSAKLSLRPFFGLKSAWVDLEQITRYTGGDVLRENTVHIKDDCKFWGLGPRAGFDTKWYLGNGFSIMGNVNGALVFGHFDVDHKERLSSAPITNRVRLHANRHAFSPMVMFQLGLAYDTYIYDDKQHIGVALFFDSQYWWRQNQMLKIDDAAVLKYERYSEDLSMHGVTLSVRWDF